MVKRYDQDEQNTKFHLANYKRALQYVKKYKGKLIAILFLNIIAAVSSLSITKILQIVIDSSIPNQNIKELLNLGVMALLLVIISCCISRIYSKQLAKVNQNIIQDIKNDLFTHIQYLSSEYYDTRPHGKIIIKLTDYAENVSNLITKKLMKTFLEIVNMFIILIFMFSTNVLLTVITVIGIVLLSILYIFTAKIKRKNKMTINHKEANLNAYLVESLKGIQITQAFNREKENEKIYYNLSENWRIASNKSLKVGNTGWATSQMMSHFVTATIYLVGATILYPKVSIGTIVAMGSYCASFWDPILELFKIIDEFIQSITYLEKLLELLDEPISITDTKESRSISIKGKIEFKNVEFAYNESNTILQNISFTIQEQEKIAIVGKTGSGKTTITNLIARFYDTTAGELLIDDIPIKQIQLDSLRKQVVIMQQDNYLFSKTILENLQYGTNKTKLEIIQICQKLQIDDWINSFHNSYDTILYNNGKNLSEGQKQILCYVRTIIQNPKILILDEATSKIDVKTEKLLQNLSKELVKNKTVIVIAHRLSTIVNSNKILFLKNKQITESGTHAELVKQEKDYYKLYKSQSEIESII